MIVASDVRMVVIEASGVVNNDMMTLGMRMMMMVSNDVVNNMMVL